jgi:hypothetical protein
MFDYDRTQNKVKFSQLRETHIPESDAEATACGTEAERMGFPHIIIDDDIIHDIPHSHMATLGRSTQANWIVLRPVASTLSASAKLHV